MSLLELRSYGLRSERLDSDTAGLGVVDGGRCIRVDDVRVGLGVVDAVPGLGVEVVGKADPDAAASGTEATFGVLETEGRDEEQTQLLFFLAGGSSPPGSRDFMGPAPGPLEWDHICNLLHKKSFNLHVDNFYDKHQHNINTLSSNFTRNIINTTVCR